MFWTKVNQPTYIFHLFFVFACECVCGGRGGRGVNAPTFVFLELNGGEISEHSRYTSV